MSKLVAVQDEEWKNDWEAITKVFELVEDFKKTFNKLDVPYFREIQQKVLILNLEKYSWSLQNYIIQKYSEDGGQ